MVAAPLTDEELIKRADLVAEARVLSRLNGRATLSLSRIIKGKPRWHRRSWRRWLGLQRTVLVSFQSQPSEPKLGEWWNEGVFVPGGRVRAHLIWDDRGQCYAAVWWNGVDNLRQ